MSLNLYSWLKKGVALSGILAAATVADAQYCTPSYAAQCGSNPSNSVINKVQVTGGLINFNNASQSPACSDPTGYKYFTNYSCKFNAGQNGSIFVTQTQNWQTGLRIWVDWSKDGDFADAGETLTAGSLIFNASTTPATYPVTFTVPGYAKQGITRMRVRTGSYTGGSVPVVNMDPCLQYVNGEVEDYDFEVVNPCLPPAVTSVSNVTYRSADFSWQPRLNAIMYEYTVDQTPAAPTSVGYTYTTNTNIHLPDGIVTLNCNTKYYIHLRSICDTPNSTIFWTYSPWTLDSFTTEECCNMPDLTLSGLTATTALFNWKAVPSVVKYEYAVSTSQHNPPLTGGTLTTYPTILLQGLSCYTQYYFYLRSHCSPTPLSDWEEMGFFTEKCTSVDKVGPESPAFVAYPNPVRDIMNVDIISHTTAKANLTLTDINGKVVLHKDVDGKQMQLNLSDVPAGMYFLKYTDDETSQVRKITKQ